MTLNVNNNFNSLSVEISDYIFSYLSLADLGHVASTSKEMKALSLYQSLKKAREILEEASKFQGIIQLPSFNPKSEDINEYHTAICSLPNIQQKIKSIPILQEIFETNHGDFSQTAQEIRDRDLVIVLKEIAPPEIQQQMEGLSNSQAAAFVRKWLRTLDPRDKFFQTTLHLTNLHLTSIPPEIFTYFPHLQSLNLTGNDIQAIPPQIGQLKKLQWLHLDFNQIQVIPPQIGQAQNLEWLNLDNNQIQVIPPQIGQLKNLQELHLDNNQTQVIPPQIGQLQILRWLGLKNNQIQVIPPQIGQLKRLERLLLEKNPIQVIPPEIEQSKRLESLYLENNPKVMPLNWQADPPPKTLLYHQIIIHKLKDSLVNVKYGIDRLKNWAYVHGPSKIICASICIATSIVAFNLFKTFYQESN